MLDMMCCPLEENSAHYAPCKIRRVSSVQHCQPTDVGNSSDSGRYLHPFLVHVGNLGWEAVATCSTVARWPSLFRCMGLFCCMGRCSAYGQVGHLDAVDFLSVVVL